MIAECGKSGVVNTNACKRIGGEVGTVMILKNGSL